MGQGLDLWLFDDAPIFGGAELFALRLAHWVERHGGPGVHARLMCPPNTELALRAGRRGVRVDSLRFPKPPRGTLAGIGALWRIRQVLAAAPPTAVAVGNTALAQTYLGAAALMVRHRPPVVHLLHERETAKRSSARWALPRSGGLVAVGENHARAYRALGARVDTINIFLEPNELDAAAASRSKWHRSGPPVIGVIGRLIPEKGILELLGELAAESGAWSKLRIAAPRQDPRYSARVSARAGETDLAGRVELLGYVEDIAAFLSTVDVVIVPSIGSEGQVLVILEALAHGIPCVVRESALSPEYAGLPVLAYTGTGDLRRALAAAAAAPVASTALLRERFGPEQALAGIQRAAGRGAGPSAGSREP